MSDGDLGDLPATNAGDPVSVTWTIFDREADEVPRLVGYEIGIDLVQINTVKQKTDYQSDI
jgi:hypothetical protein